jgi:hypothetical protein
MIKLPLIFFLIVLPFISNAQNNVSEKFEKIIFNTTTCYGKCPVYHLQIDNKKNVKLLASIVYKNPRVFGTNRSNLDTSKMGYFIGHIDDTLYNNLIKTLSNTNTDSLCWEDNGADAPIKTIIIYHNGQREFLRSMFPPKDSYDLIILLCTVCEKNNFQKTIEKFEIENP